MFNDFSMKTTSTNYHDPVFNSRRRNRTIRRRLTMEAAKTFVSSFVWSRIDYCNSFLRPASIIYRPPRRCSPCQRMTDIRRPQIRSSYSGALSGITLASSSSVYRLQIVSKCIHSSARYRASLHWIHVSASFISHVAFTTAFSRLWQNSLLFDTCNSECGKRVRGTIYQQRSSHLLPFELFEWHSRHIFSELAIPS